MAGVGLRQPDRSFVPEVAGLLDSEEGNSLCSSTAPSEKGCYRLKPRHVIYQNPVRAKEVDVSRVFQLARQPRGARKCGRSDACERIKVKTEGPTCNNALEETERGDKTLT
jgi:hypothetical protein